MDKDFNDFQNNLNFGSIPNGIEINEMYKDPMFNPILQYEQAFMYYRYLTCQMEYKIRCKEYEKMCKNENKNERRVVE